MKQRNRERALQAAVVATCALVITPDALSGPTGSLPAPNEPNLITPATEGGTFDSKLEKIWSIPKLVDDPDATFLNKFALTGRYHGQYYNLDSDRGDDSDWENRRLWFGGDMTIFKKLRVKADVVFDTDAGDYDSLYEAYAAYQHGPEFNVAAGRRELLFTNEFVSSKYMLTFERSIFGEQLRVDTAVGAWVNGKVGNFLYDLGIYSGDLESEFSDFGEGWFYGISLGYDCAGMIGAEKSVVRFDWLLNDTDSGANVPRPYDSAFALGTTNQFDKRWGLVADVVYGSGKAGVPDAWGFTVMPTFNFTEKWQAVVRFQFGDADGDGLVAPGRYYRRAPDLTDNGMGDRWQAVYGGLNYYILDHRLKLMAGVEYGSMDDGAGDGGDIDAWTGFTGIRLYF